MTATLGLGTVQFGMAYGMADPRPRSNEREVTDILALAARRGVSVLDTAAEYGDSEAVLGRALESSGPFRIVTKSPPFAAEVITETDADTLEKSLTRSLLRLGTSQVYGLLVHRSADLLKSGGERLAARLESLKANKRIQRWGVSVYDSAQVERVMERFRPDIVQAPLNAVDRRLIDSGHLAALAAAHVEVHVRSVLMQGLLLKMPDDLPPALHGARPMLRAFREAAAQAGLAPLDAALAFVRQQKEADVVLVGAPGAAELEEILSAWERGAGAAEVKPLSDPSWSRWLDIRNWQHA